MRSTRARLAGSRESRGQLTLRGLTGRKVGSTTRVNKPRQSVCRMRSRGSQPLPALQHATPLHRVQTKPGAQGWEEVGRASASSRTSLGSAAININLRHAR